MSHADLSDEDKLEEAIRFVAVGQPLPEVLKVFLEAAGLYDMIVNPKVLIKENVARS